MDLNKTPVPFPNVVQLFLNLSHLIGQGKINVNDPLDKLVLSASLKDLSYVDGRKTALKLGFDIWKDVPPKNRVDSWIMYSNSWVFPDFMFKSVLRTELVGGEMLELKDSKSSSISSFNSTLPTETKSLAEAVKLNGSKGKVLRKISEIFDKNSIHSDWMNYRRKVFYMIRTEKETDRVKLSIVDGAFFETLPEHVLLKRMFMNIFHRNVGGKAGADVEKKANEVFDWITDHHAISFSQDIPGASIKPRLRIMAEVKPEGNPHSRFYPIAPKTLNLIVKEKDGRALSKVLDAKISQIKHINDGTFYVFSYGADL